MSADLDDRVEAWIEAEWSEYAGQLTPSDLRRGIQGLSGLYVHDRSKGQISARAGAGAARRAAFSVYFAPLHFLTVWWGLASTGWPDTAGRTILDLGADDGQHSEMSTTSCLVQEQDLDSRCRCRRDGLVL